MPVNVADLVAKLSLDVAGIDRGIADMQSKFGRIEQVVKSAGKAVDGVRTPLKKLDDSAMTTGKSIYEATHATRLMTEQLITQLNPALGSIVQATTMAARGFQGFSFGVAALAIGSTVIIATIAQMVAAINKAAVAQVELNTAVRSFDLGSVRSQIVATIKEMDAFDARSKTFLGSVANFFLGGLDFVTGNDLSARSAKELLALDKLVPLENKLAAAQNALRESGERRGLTEVLLSGAELEHNLPLYDTYIRVLGSIINLQEQAAKEVAETTVAIKRQALEARAAGPNELAGLDAELKSALSTAATAADAQRRALAARALQGRINIPAEQRDIATRQQFGIEEPSFHIDPQAVNAIRAAAEGPMVTLALAEQRIGREAALMGIEFDKGAAELDSVKRAIIEFNPAVENATERLADLNARFDALRQVEDIKSLVTSGFDGLKSGIHDVVTDILAGTKSIEQSFAAMGRSISASLIENVINRGLKVVQDALFRFLEDAAKTGLLKVILNAVGGAFGSLFTSSAPNTGTAANSGTLGSPGPKAEGGIISSPSFPLVGEAGPEAIIPLKGGAVPVRMLGGAGGSVVVNVFNQAPGTTAEHSERTGDAGQKIHDIVIREIKRGAQTGELDSIMGIYNVRRPGLTR